MDFNLLILKLRRSASFYQRLANAGKHSAQMFAWLDQNSAKSIALLDFDVVCASLPTKVAQQHLGARDIEAGFSQLESLFGPHSLSTVLCASNEAPFSLPYGTLYELIDERSKLEKRLFSEARNWFSLFETASQSSSPADLLLQKSRGASIAEQMLDGFIKFAHDYEDSYVLERIYSNHEPFDTLVMEVFDERAQRAYETVLTRLQDARAEFPQNNRRDALNVECHVRHFNHPNWLRGKRPVPFLITETTVLKSQDFDDDWYDVSYFDQKPPALVNRRFFLQVFRSLLTAHDNLERVAIDEAELLSNQAARLSNSIGSVLARLTRPARAVEPVQGRIAKSRRHSSEVPPVKDVFPADQAQELTSIELALEIENIDSRRRAFDEYWGQFFRGTLLARQHDATMLLNLLDNPTFRASVCQQMSQHIERRDWNRLIKNLRLPQHPDYDTFDVLAKFGRLDPVQISKRGFRDLHLSFGLNEGLLLCEAKPGANLDSFDRTLLEQEHELRFWAHRLRSKNGAVLAFDTWRYDRSRRSCYNAIVWAHRFTVEEAVGMGIRLLDQNELRIEKEAVYTIKQFAPGWDEVKTLPRGEYSTKQLRKKIWKKTRHFELQRGSLLFFCDLQPIDSLETQAGIVFPCGRLTPAGIAAMSTEIESSSILPISAAECRAAVAFILTDVLGFTL
jgi:hypothetical protein